MQQTECCLRFLQTDKEGEYMIGDFPTFPNLKGNSQKIACAYTLHLNGIVEQMNQTSFKPCTGTAEPKISSKAVLGCRYGVGGTHSK